MTSISRLMLTTACAAGIISSTYAAGDIQKNKPARRDVEQILQEIGGDHFPEKMKISPIGPVETDSTYYHVFSGTLKKAGFHLIFFDNTPTYLGYYYISLEPIGYGEGEVELYLTSDSTVIIPIGDEGPPEKIRLGDTGQQAKFVRAPVKEEPVEEQPVASKNNAPVKAKKVPEYRSWTITKSGKALNIPSAIFVEMKDENISIMNAKNGLIATVPVKSLSSADKQYLKDLFQ